MKYRIGFSARVSVLAAIPACVIGSQGAESEKSVITPGNLSVITYQFTGHNAVK